MTASQWNRSQGISCLVAVVHSYFKKEGTHYLTPIDPTPRLPSVSLETNGFNKLSGIAFPKSIWISLAGLIPPRTYINFVSTMSLEKDRGWSWVVLISVCIAQLLSLGQVLSFGIFFIELLNEFRCTRQEAALVGSLAFGVKCFAAAPASVMQRKYGCRLVVMTGGVLASTGFFLSYFASKLWHLYVTYTIVGLGFGCTFVPSIGAIPDYFDKYRFFATALAPVGSAIGTFLFSPFYYYLIASYTWRGAMLILSGITLQITLCGAVLRSRSKNKTLTWSSSLEWSLLSNGKFLLLLLEAVCFGGTTVTVFTMANSLAMKYGLTKGQSTLIVGTAGLCNVAGRVISALMSISANLNRPMVFALATSFCGVTAIGSVLFGTWWTVAMFLGLYGLAFGAKVSQLVPVMMEIFGLKRLVNAMGYYMFVVGISGILGPWTAGLLVEKTRIENAYWLAGSLSLLAGIVCFVIVIWHSKTKSEQLEMELVTSITGHQTDRLSAAKLLKDEQTETNLTNAEESGMNCDCAMDLEENKHSSRDAGAPESTPRGGWRPAILSLRDSNGRCGF